jgi:hypothetical protein
VAQLAAHHGFKEYRVYFASDSAAMVTLYTAVEPKGRVFAREVVRPKEGEGWAVAGFTRAASDSLKQRLAEEEVNMRWEWEYRQNGPGRDSTSSSGGGGGGVGVGGSGGSGGQCARDTQEGLLEMIALGLTDLLLVTKKSEFPGLSKAIAHGRGSTYCEVRCGANEAIEIASGQLQQAAFYCVDAQGHVMVLAHTPLADTGYPLHGKESKTPPCCS